MGLKIQKYNVLFGELGAIKDELKLAEDILYALKSRQVNLYKKKVIPALAEVSLLPSFNATIDDLLEKAPSMPNSILYRAGIDVKMSEDELRNAGIDPKAPREVILPLQEQFVINLEPYYEFGGIPKNLNELRQFYNLFAGEGIPVTFINTIGNGATKDLEALAGELLIGSFSEIQKGMIVGVDYHNESMPPVLNQMLHEMMKKSSTKRTTVLDASVHGGAYLANMPEGHPEKATEAVVDKIHSRLRYIRQWDYAISGNGNTQVVQQPLASDTPTPKMRRASLGFEF